METDLLAAVYQYQQFYSGDSSETVTAVVK
jgi:hypothetical protein